MLSWNTFIHGTHLALPSTPTDLAMKCVMPNSGSDCHAWINRIFASMRLIWATFWWASRIRAVIWVR